MTQEKFTPSRWELGKNGNIYSKKFPGMLIATSHKTHYNNLIASAPDMYEALKEIAENYDLFKSTKNMAALTLAAKAKAVLSKANGKITK